MPPALDAHQVVVRFGQRAALRNVSLSVDTQECVALVGESGSGKTSLLRTFNRLTPLHSGTVRIEGADVSTLDETALRRRIGYVPQDGGLLPHWTVGRNVALVPWLLGHPDVHLSADRALELLGLAPSEFSTRFPRHLSGGQRQRVAIARALAASPRIVLLDEPFGALDAITRAELQTAFLALRARASVTAIVVTHDLAEACRLADRVAVLRAGVLEHVGPPASLFERPGSGYVEELLRRADARRDWLR